MNKVSNNVGELHVLLQSSNTYVVPTAIALYSLCENNTSIQNLVIHLISDGIQPDNISWLESKVEPFGRKIHWIDGSYISKMLEKAGAKKHCGSYTTFMKLFALGGISQKYPDCEKVFYIDSDTIVAGSLTELITLDMSGYVIGAVDEYISEKYRKMLGVKNNSFNGGVILFHVDEWERNDCEKIILEKLQSSQFVQSLQLADQDIMNRLFEKKTMRIPVKYNLTPLFVFYDRDVYVQKLHLNNDFYTKQEIQEAIKSPAVVHYIDVWTGRPWDVPNANPFTKLYEKYSRLANIQREFATVERRGVRKIAKNGMVHLLRVLPKSMGGFLIYNLGRFAQITGIK